MFDSSKVLAFSEKLALEIIRQHTADDNLVSYRVQRGRISWIEKVGGAFVLHEYFTGFSTHLRHQPATLSRANKEEQKGYYLHAK